MKELKKTEHVWIHGPHGMWYHCVICGISKCEDHDGTNCEMIILERAAKIKKGMTMAWYAEKWKKFLSK